MGISQRSLNNPKETATVAQQILIVGLGQFGMSLAHALSDKGAEVLAVDRRRIWLKRRRLL